jgi:multidrug efflux pump subunit AcrA (membrane-fusion protein)
MQRWVSLRLAGQVITSVISANNFEVDAYVPETDIGKVAIGNPVSMTFDAFPGETFAGKVFYIDPAQTIESGVVDYLVKVSFNTPDSRIKSGLTANLDINARRRIRTRSSSRSTPSSRMRAARM